MRVLLIPELYRPSDASANGTLNDAVTWVERWVGTDDRMHVYWLMPPRSTADYDRSYVHADHERVTLLEAPWFMSESEHGGAFTDSGYSTEQFETLRREVFGRSGYVDVVVDHLRHGRTDLTKWILLNADHQPGRPSPFSVVTYVHDLLSPDKYPESRHLDEFCRRTETTNAVLSDGLWFKSRLDVDRMREFGSTFLDSRVLEDALDAAVMSDSPIDFGRFEESYADQPRWLHVAGSFWRKKHADVVLDVAEMLYDRFGIRTILTSMDDVPERYRDRPYVEARPRASRATYERMLRRGDLAVCASEYDTLARTYFEQAASGQVLIARDQPWVRECVPPGQELLVPLEDLADRVVWAVEHWPAAVAANRRLVAHLERVRDPEASARRLYRDLHRRVRARSRTYRSAVPGTVERAIGELASDGAPGADCLTTERVHAVATGQASGTQGRAAGTRAIDDPLDPGECSLYDVVYGLRASGYRDSGNAGVPVFRRT